MFDFCHFMPSGYLFFPSNSSPLLIFAITVWAKLAKLAIMFFKNVIHKRTQ